MTDPATLKNILANYTPASWTERRVLAYAHEQLDRGAEPAAVLADLDAARDEIINWIRLEERYGIAEVLKLIGEQLTTSWYQQTKPTATSRLADLSGTPAQRTRDPHPAAFAVFNLWPKHPSST